MKKINWDYWKKRDSWTLLEAFLLLNEIEPEPIDTTFEQTPENNFGNIFKNATSLENLRQLLILTKKKKRFNINITDEYDSYPIELFFVNPQDLVVKFYEDPDSPIELIKDKDFHISSDGKKIFFSEPPEENNLIVECLINRTQIKKYLQMIDLIFDGIINKTLPSKKTQQDYNVIPAKFVSWCLEKELNISDELKAIAITPETTPPVEAQGQKDFPPKKESRRNIADLIIKLNSNGEVLIYSSDVVPNPWTLSQIGFRNERTEECKLFKEIISNPYLSIELPKTLSVKYERKKKMIISIAKKLIKFLNEKHNTDLSDWHDVFDNIRGERKYTLRMKPGAYFKGPKTLKDIKNAQELFRQTGDKEPYLDVLSSAFTSGQITKEELNNYIKEIKDYPILSRDNKSF